MGICYKELLLTETFNTQPLNGSKSWVFTISWTRHCLPVMPVITQPMFSVILNRCVTVKASNSLSWEKHKDKDKREMYTTYSASNATTIMTAVESDHMLCEDTETQTSVFIMCSCVLTGTFFCVTTTTQSFPLTATEVSPPWFMALKAYSEDR